MENPNAPLDEAYTLLCLALNKTEALNTPDSAFRSRELSLAITRMEEAMHWFQANYRKIEG